MCTTPAPPSTALVAASIWSGTGEVKTSPQHAASSMPRPTKPACSGSWPDPPPEMRPTLPGVGPVARYTTLFSWSTCSCGCAASTPSSASLTTSAGSLISFFISCLHSDVRRGQGHDRRRGGGRAGERPERQGRRHAGEALGAQIDRQLRPVDRPAPELLDQHGTDCARRVDGRAGGRGHGNDRREHDQTDRQAGETGRGLAVDDTEDGEDEDEPADELGGEGLRPVYGRPIRGNAQPDVGCLLAEYRDDCQRADDGAGHLGGEVAGNLAPGELAARREAQGDG